MIGDWLRRLGSRSGRAAGEPVRTQLATSPPPLVPKELRDYTKPSLGLAQFVSSIRDESGLSILDLGEISQSNVSFITSLGHRLHSVDFLRTLDSLSLPGDPPGGPSQRDQMEAFLDQTFDFERGSLDGALVWDCLQYLNRPLLLATVDRLYEVLRPRGHLLALFQNAERIHWAPVYSYRVVDQKTMHLTMRSQRQPVHSFNNRGIEKLFEGFESVKFFLSRDNLREVIVRR